MAAHTIKRVVGWSGRSEWIQVYEELYSDNIQKQKRALDRIAVWKCRVIRLSTAIECTWELLSAELQYQYVKDDTSFLEQDRMLRILFAMALIRFINLITEKGQTSKFVQPVHQIADNMGLPQWMVALRHDAVHSNLPSLTVLRNGVQIALAWLKEVYWEAQLEEEDPDFVHKVHPLDIPASETIEHVTQILEAYSNQYFSLFSAQDSSPSKEEVRQLSPILDDLERVLGSNREVALPVLLQDGLMLLSQEQLRAFKIKKKDLEAARDLTLPDQLLCMWTPVLQVIHRLRATKQFLTLLLTQSPDCSFFRQRQAMGWVMHIINSRDGNRSAVDPLRSVYRNVELDFLKYHGILKTCLENPNCYTPIILPRLIKLIRPRLSEEQEERLKALVDIYSGTGSKKNDVETDEQETVSAETYTVESICNVGKPMEWSECPLGHWPGQALTYTSLDLPEHVNNLNLQGLSTSSPRPTHTPTRPMNAKNRSAKTGRRKSVDMDSDVEADLKPSKCSRNTEWTPEEMTTIQNQISLNLM